MGYLHQKTVGGSVTMMDHTQLTGKILHTKKVLERILTRGCGCKKGCRRKQEVCGPGCVCSGCTNVPVQVEERPESGSEDSDSTSDSEISSDDLETEIITDHFLSVNID